MPAAIMQAQARTRRRPASRHTWTHAACGYNEPVWASKDDYPGNCYSRVDLDDPRAKSILDRVRQTRRDARLVIVSAHWGGNWGFEPPEEDTAFGRALIDAGAGIVFGHSAHVFREIDIQR